MNKKIFNLNLFFLICLITNANTQRSGLAEVGYFESFGRCCEKNPNFDPQVTKENCHDYNNWYFKIILIIISKNAMHLISKIFK